MKKKMALLALAATALGVANLDKPLPRKGVYEEN